MNDGNKRTSAAVQAATMQGGVVQFGGINLSQPISEEEASKLLAVQQDLLRRRYRGNMQQLRKWVRQSEKWQGAEANGAAVAILLHERDLRRLHSTLDGNSGYIEAQLNAYGPLPRGLRTSDFLYHETAWNMPKGTCCLISPNRVLTANHVVDRTAEAAIVRKELYVVFDFQTLSDDAPRRVFSKSSSVFRVGAIGPRGADQTNPAEDWATLILENSPTQLGRKPCRIASALDGPLGEVYALGHPNGLAMRYTYSGASGTSSQSAGCYVAFLDGYDGASGSPVFDAASHEIVGVLIQTCSSAEGVVNTVAGDYLSLVCAAGYSATGSLFVGARSFGMRALQV